MRRIALLFICAVSVFAAKAQLTLTGTSYTQNFDGIAAGLPTGWQVQTGSTTTSIGTAGTYSATAAPWQESNGRFKNCASANSLTSSANSTAQAAAIDRALSVRQNASMDSGSAFVLQLANTNGFGSFNMSFKLQSLDDTCSRIVTWLVDYGVGSNPASFTPVTATGTMTTGGRTFTNNTITVNFGTALDNYSGPVWIRIVTLTRSVLVSGANSGSRPTTGIDDFSLTWTNGGTTNYRPNITALSPANGSVNVPTSSNLAVTFDRQISKGTGNIIIKNETDQTSQTIDVTSSDVAVAANVATISNVTLALSKSYHVTFDASAFDTAGFNSYGITDTGVWKFKTAGAAVTSINEQFDNACANGGLPSGWSQQSVVGPSQIWACSGASTAPNYYVTMNGYAAGANNANEDWLITPLLDLSAVNNPAVFYRSRFRFAGDVLHAFTSADYTGTGNPNNATWTDLNINYVASDTVWRTKSSAISNATKYVAFRYISTTTDGSRWDVDSVVVTGTTGIANLDNNAFPVTVIGQPGSNHIMVGFSVETAAIITASVYDITGREVYRQSLQAVSGDNRITLNPGALQSGMYFVRIVNGYQHGTAKAVIH